MSDTQLATRPNASQQLAAFIGMERGAMLDTIKAQCFKGNPQNISNEQLAAFVSIAVEMGVNPLLPGMLYAFPTQGGGIVPMMGPDGVYKKLSEHPEIESWETEVFPADVALPPTHATTKIFRRGREKPLSYTALVSEWKVGNNPNWNTRPRHMIGLRSLKQCARQIIHGIPHDEDERVIMGEINVTPAAEPETPARPAAPKRSPKGAAAVQENPKPADKPIEAEIVQPKAEVAPPAKEAPKAAPAPVVEDPAPKAPEPRTSLNDGEVLETTCKVESVQPLMVKSGGDLKASVMATVSGGFNGSVMHIGGGEVPEGEKDPVPLPVWQGNVHLTLRGRLNKASGRMLVMVDKITEAQSESPTVSVE